MNYFQVKDFFKSMFPGKQVVIEFDESTPRQYEIIMTNGKPNPVHHIEHHHVKVTVEGAAPQYVPIQPHRESITWPELMKRILGMPSSTEP